MSVMPDDPMASAFNMALLLPLHQTPMEPKEIAVCALTGCRYI